MLVGMVEFSRGACAGGVVACSHLLEAVGLYKYYSVLTVVPCDYFTLWLSCDFRRHGGLAAVVILRFHRAFTEADAASSRARPPRCPCTAEFCARFHELLDSWE